MIRVKLDGAEVGVAEQNLGTVGDVVGTVAQEIDESLRIVRVCYNGEDITGQPDRHLEPVHGSGDFELETADAKQLALETLESIEQFHGELTRELTRSADEFRSGSFERSNEIFARCIDGLQVLLRTTHSTAALLQLDAESVTAGNQNLTELTEKISGLLSELIEAQENRDGILIADLIEYELQVMLEDWQAGLVRIRQAGRQR
ncbi:MAG: hypothetical protein MAG453_01233 [Calditrichaeota bacterium]|nr:hypothetical protein [Calditrichota bacterium]